ncbi:MAG: dTDP-4-dehydrorhamnose 3,5-epimerase family protein, partial [Candidatus Marinimicrobia bacterium]|nr:dTDP-4-dehydrorhamnose 3,5-epimerase family protein [Candidatus Neomarinimicrobiota bacterium]
RGSLTKIYAGSLFRNLGIGTQIREVYYSVSGRNVIRGMHFQAPPAQHGKLVSVSFGSVRDVILDLRKDGPHYGKTADILLSAERPHALYIPPGFAHGFLSLEDNTVMQYLVSAEHSPEHDKGIRWDSVNVDWGVAEPVISDRDRRLPPFHQFVSPF